MQSAHDLDVLVIGGGGAGALAAIEASEDSRLRVAVVSRGPMGQSGLTPTANGGTSRAVSPEAFFNEMMAAGDFLNDQDLVWFMAEQINPALERLKELGADHIVYKPDRCFVPSTGGLKAFRAILAKRPNVAFHEDVLITMLMKDRERIAGAIGLDLRSGRYLIFRAPVVILATGGCAGDMYPLSSDNPFNISSSASGAGHMLAFQAGAELLDMEMVQFVPVPVDPLMATNLRFFPDFWASPYYDRHGNLLMENVARYIGGSYSYRFTRLVYETELRGDGPVYIDQTRMDESKLPKGKIPAWAARRARFNLLDINPFKRPVKLTIGSHFNMGGVRVDAHTHTSVPGLLAAGEIMGGVHGGLRIAGYSFSQMIVFGLEAGRAAARLARETDMPAPPDSSLIEQEIQRVESFLQPRPDAVNGSEVLQQLQQLMQKHVFLVRTEAGLAEAREKIHALQRDALPRVRVSGKRRYNLDWPRAVELGYTLDAAEIVVQCAQARRESRGFHWREDYPNPVDPLPRHTVAHRRDQLEVSMEPVNMCLRMPEEAS